eukprot:COSAG06_NODE_12460_length_1378_cov_7.503518_3_plen_106_part_00
MPDKRIAYVAAATAGECYGALLRDGGVRLSCRECNEVGHARMRLRLPGPVVPPSLSGHRQARAAHERKHEHKHEHVSVATIETVVLSQHIPLMGVRSSGWRSFTR